jgi:hypothetical protein
MIHKTSVEKSLEEGGRGVNKILVWHSSEAAE